MENIAKSLVVKYLSSIGINGDYNIRTTWSCYILGNIKWIFSTDVEDNLYFEVTYNRNKSEMYLDVYGKRHNEAFSIPENV